MDWNWSAEEIRFREEVRDFLAEALTPDLRGSGRRMTSVYGDPQTSLAWQ